MKKISIYLLGLVFTVAACSKEGTPVEQLTTVEVETEKKEVADIPTIPHTFEIPPGGIEWGLPKYPSATDSKTFFEVNKTSPNGVNTVKVKKIYLKLLSSDTSNFNFMDYVKVYISANGYDEILVGQQTNIPKGIKTIETVPQDVELKNYFVQDTIYFRVVPHFIDYPPSSGQLEMGATFKVSITGSKF